MASATTHRVRGHITLIQESRFRLVSDTGQGFLFTLAHNAAVGHQDLERFYRAGTAVTVEYTGEPNLASAIAHSVRPDAPLRRDPHV